MIAQPADYYFDSTDGLQLYCRIYPAHLSGGLPALCLSGLTRNSHDFVMLAAHLSAQREVLAAIPVPDVDPKISEAFKLLPRRLPICGR